EWCPSGQDHRVLKLYYHESRRLLLSAKHHCNQIYLQAGIVGGRLTPYAFPGQMVRSNRKRGGEEPQCRAGLHRGDRQESSLAAGEWCRPTTPAARPWNSREGYLRPSPI